MADTPLIDSIARWAADGTCEIEEHHACDASSAVVDRRSKTVSTTAITTITVIGGRVGPGSSGTY